MLPFNKEIIDKVRNMVIYIIQNIYKPDLNKLNYLMYTIDKRSYLKYPSLMSEMMYITSAYGPIPVSPCTRNHILTEYCSDLFKNRNKLILKDNVKFDDGEFTDQDLEILTTTCGELEYIQGKHIADNLYKEVFYQIYFQFGGENQIIDFEILDYDFDYRTRLIREKLKKSDDYSFFAFVKLHEALKNH